MTWWQYDHEVQNDLIARDGWMCEEHVGVEWPHGDCAGPGQAWRISGKDAIRAALAAQIERCACIADDHYSPNTARAIRAQGGAS